ncbi:methylmalonyl-CoA mutase family protein [Micromonospora sp. NPDC049175]|uniref:methylmalonyl-CoA mutase family protein n=1 Tax=Micromonospora sp. NPDC049175 TaxID=3364266 RepID=UPI0037215AE3
MTAAVDQWRRQALAALRRSGDATETTPLDQVADLLATRTYDGLRIDALRTPHDPATPPTGLPGRWPFVRGTRVAGGWDVRQRHGGEEPKDVRESIRDDLDNGVTSVWLDADADALPELLDGVDLGRAGVTLDAGADFAAAGAAFLRHRPGDRVGGLGADPLGWRARTGAEADVRAAAALAVRCVAEAPTLRAITVDATVYHEAGGSDAQELGCAAATGVAYLRALTDAGLTVEDALHQLEFRYAADADQFATIAKFRAARRIWSRIAELCAAPDAGGQVQHAVTSAAMMTVRDPWVNLLRTTVAAFAAAVGGAGAVTVLPFDDRLGQPDPAARRLARCTQLVLLEEAHIGRVTDPGGGSHYVEHYTQELAEAGWDWFTTIERAGGLAAALDCGLIPDRLAATRARRAENIAHRRDPITGVSEFPDLDDVPPERLPAPAPPGGGLPRYFYAEAFERLRDRADAHPSRPVVFLATLGAPAVSGARATFAANLFAAGGIAVVTGPVEEFAASRTAVACVCGPDEAVPAAVAALREAGAKRVWVAGGDLRQGCDAVEVLTRSLDDLGVRP